MSFLTDIGNFAYETARKVKHTVAEFVSGENSDAKKADKKPNAIIQQTNLGSNVDEFVPAGNTTQRSTKTNNPQNKKISAKMEQAKMMAQGKCASIGANYGAILGMLKTQGVNINNLSEEEQIKHFNAISENIDIINDMKRKGILSKKTDINAWIAYGVNLKMRTNEIGVSDNYDNYLQKNLESFVKGIKSTSNYKIALLKSAQEQDKITDEYADLIDDALGINDNWLEKIGKSFVSIFVDTYSDEAKEVKVRKLQKERDALLEDMQLRAAAGVDDNNQLKALARLGDADNMGHSFKLMSDTRLGNNAKMAFNDSVSAQDIMGLVDSYNDSFDKNPNHSLFGKDAQNRSFSEICGCRNEAKCCSTGWTNGGRIGGSGKGSQFTGCSAPMDGTNGQMRSPRRVTPQSVGDATATVASGKSNEGLKNFENDLVKIRESVENGSDEYTKEITRIMHSGVGAGALLNSNLTEEQKIEFATNWDNDARKFGSSYEQVKAGSKAIIQQYIQKYGKDNPELVANLKRLEKKIDEIIAQQERTEDIKNKEAEKIEEKIKAEKKKIETANKQKVGSDNSDEESIRVAKVHSDPIKAQKAYSRTVIQAKNNSKSGSNNVVSGTLSVDEIKNQSVSEVVQTILIKGYDSIPAGTTRLKVTLTNPILRRQFLPMTDQDFKAVQSVAEILPTLNLCPTSVRIYAAEHVNPRIKDELIEELKQTSSHDFAVIIDAKDSNNEKEVKDKENAIC